MIPLPRLPLHEAVFKNDIVKVSALLRDAKDPNLATPEVTDFVRVNLACVAYTCTVLYTLKKGHREGVYLAVCCKGSYPCHASGNRDFVLFDLLSVHLYLNITKVWTLYIVVLVTK